MFCLTESAASFLDLEKRLSLKRFFVFAFGVGIIFSHLASLPALASELDDAKALLRAGDYAACTELAKTQVEKGVWNEEWPRLLVECYLTTGKYSEALTAFELGLERFGKSIRMRLLGVRVYRMNNLALKAKEQLSFIDNLLDQEAWRFNTKSDLVPLGEYFLLRDEDPKQVLKICFDQAAKFDPKSIDPLVATARMALDKNDDKVASQALTKAVKLDEKSPEVFYLMARAWSATEPSKATEYLQKSIELNPNYIPSLIMQAESRISAEDYATAVTILESVAKINPSHPKTLALRAVIAHLRGEYADEGELRRTALLPWSLNPEVDYVIGKHLSMHYRFAEAVEYQKRAIQMDADYTPAKAQLAQDLLRLGQLEAGWELVDNVRTKDPYDVTIFNLKQLQSQLEKFATLEAPGFVIRMDAREAKIYGDEVVDLLTQARAVLTEKYEAKLEEPIYVEIFPRQKEFAIRTFGLPGGEGFLGVCFGRLITANSPAALNVDSNWKAVLWHEYCHVVTLQKTKNKMPRWLSEGISVYEERQRNPIWGQSMDPTYREMLLGEDFVPMSKLSSAFLQPKSPMHLQFAYYEASLAVEFWVEKYGHKALLRLLEDLSVGMPPNDALKRIPGSLEELDEEFHKYATAKANEYGEGLDFAKPTEEDKEDLQAWSEEHPKSIFALRTRCQALILGKKWDEAAEVANELQTLLPSDARADGVYAMQATIQRALNNTDLERQALMNLAERCADCQQAFSRLIELDQENGDWKSVSQWSQRLIEIDPLSFDLQLANATSSEKMELPEIAVRSLLACLELDPSDPASIHYRLAKAYHKLSQLDKAKRHVLLALEQSPRYLEALQLLANISESSKAQTAVQAATEGEKE